MRSGAVTFDVTLAALRHCRVFASTEREVGRARRVGRPFVDELTTRHGSGLPPFEDTRARPDARSRV
jgi:hypothetical protein